MCVTQNLVQHDLPLLTALVATADLQAFKEAASGTDKEEWIKAMNLEMASLMNKEVFELKPLPKEKRAIGC